MNERQLLKSFEAKMYAKCDITANSSSRGCTAWDREESYRLRNSMTGMK